MPGVSAPNNTESKGPKHLNMIEMAAPSIYIISHTTYHTILPEFCDVRPRVTVFVKKNSIHQFYYKSDLYKDSDIIILNILNSEIPDFQIINIYNKNH